MPIIIPQGFKIISDELIDERVVLTKEQMRKIGHGENYPDHYFALCSDDNKLYYFDINNKCEEDTGKFKVAAVNDAELEEQLKKKVDINSSSPAGTSKFINEGDGGLIQFDNTTDDVISAFAVNDGAASKLRAQIYAVDKSSKYGTRINITEDGAYYCPHSDHMTLNDSDEIARRCDIEEAVGSSQADWEEKDPTHASYIKNKPDVYTKDEAQSKVEAAAQHAVIEAELLGIDERVTKKVATIEDTVATLDGEVRDLQSDVEYLDNAKANKNDVEEKLNLKVDKKLGYSLVQDTEIEKLATVEEGAEVNVQSDWAQTDATKDDFIKNKPVLGALAAHDTVDDNLIDNVSMPKVIGLSDALNSKVSKLDTAVQPGVFYKVDCNEDGLVTRGASELVADDIPLLPINKVIDLRTDLDSRATNTKVDTLQGEVTTINGEVKENTGNISYVIGRIPPTPGDTSYLATETYVNAKVRELSGYYITKDEAGNSFETEEELMSAEHYYHGGAEITILHENDWAIVKKGKEGKPAKYCWVHAGNSNADTDISNDDPDATWQFMYSIQETTFTDAQMLAINSGITPALVTKFTDYEKTKQDKFDVESAEYAALHSGIKASHLTTLSNNCHDIEVLAGTSLHEKQDKLSIEQTLAVDSGITATLVAQYDNYATSIRELNEDVAKVDAKIDTTISGLGSAVTATNGWALTKVVQEKGVLTDFEEVKLPTDLSELSNESTKFQNFSEVNQLINDKVEPKLDTTVALTNTADKYFFSSGDTYIFSLNNKNLSSGATGTSSQVLPLASDSQSGFMSSSDVKTLRDHTTRIAALEGKSNRLIYVTYNELKTIEGHDNAFYIKENLYFISNTTPGLMTVTCVNTGEITSADENNDVVLVGITYNLMPAAYPNYVIRYTTKENINQFAINEGYVAPFTGLAVVIDYTNHVWHYYINKESGEVIGWRDDGSDSVSTFTNETEGAIKGAAVDGKVCAESDGTGSVYGWSELKTRVENLEKKPSNVVTFTYGDTVPETGSVGEIFINTSTNRIYIYNGAMFEAVNTYAKYVA